MKRRIIQGLVVATAAALSLLVAQPAFADTSTTVPDQGHYVGGTLRSKLSSGSILWDSDDGSALVQWNMQDTYTDGYSAKVWVTAYYTLVLPGGGRASATVTRTDGSGNIVYKNSGWFQPVCWPDAACSAGTNSFGVAWITIEIGRTSGDRTLVGTFFKP